MTPEFVPVESHVGAKIMESRVSTHYSPVSRKLDTRFIQFSTLIGAMDINTENYKVIK